MATTLSFDAPSRPVTAREFWRLRRAVIVLTLAWAATLGWMLLRPPVIPHVLALERLEIVEPDGALAFVLANSQRPAAATIDGQILMRGQEEERRGVPSMIFFDGHGDEVGGFLLGARETDDGYAAVRHLSLDGYKQDQTIVLSHSQDPQGSSSTLQINDRPTDLSLLEALARLGLEPGAPRAAIGAALQAMPEEGRSERLRELFGVTRVQLGSTRTRDASLVLRDGQGRPRIVIKAPADGDPSIRVLNADGEVVARLPQ